MIARPAFIALTALAGTAAFTAPANQPRLTTRPAPSPATATAVRQDGFIPLTYDDKTGKLLFEVARLDDGRP